MENHNIPSSISTPNRSNLNSTPYLGLTNFEALSTETVNSNSIKLIEKLKRQFLSHIHTPQAVNRLQTSENLECPTFKIKQGLSELVK